MGVASQETLFPMDLQLSSSEQTAMPLCRKVCSRGGHGGVMQSHRVPPGARRPATQASTNGRSAAREQGKETVEAGDGEIKRGVDDIRAKEESDSDSEEALISDEDEDEDDDDDDDDDDDGVANPDNMRQHSYPPRQFSPPFPPEPERRPFVPVSQVPLSLRFPNGLTSVLERREREESPASRASSVSSRSENTKPSFPVTITAHRRHKAEELFDFRVVEPDGSLTWRSEDSVEAEDRNAVYAYWDSFPDGRRHFMQADVWYIAQVEAHVPRNRGTSVRVRWVGSPVRTWERQSRVRQIAPGLLDDYWCDTAAQVVGKRGSSGDDTNVEDDEAVDGGPKRLRVK
ncbi:hypothetical protein QQX98_011786 [Neonectria punicea]|uniref:Chromo domain-containing protein n=1 Tax=Neonectria punicea TaxID=979145 RepID=A0ABR1GKT9_9HYPO